MLGRQKCALFAKQTFLWILKSWTMRQQAVENFRRWKLHDVGLGYHVVRA